MTNGFPTWAAKEIAEAVWNQEETWKGTGYILDVDTKKHQADTQFYEPLPDGRHIATLDLPQGLDTNGLEKGVVYLFDLKAFSVQLSSRLCELLTKEYSVRIDKIYRFEMQSMEEYS